MAHLYKVTLHGAGLQFTNPFINVFGYVDNNVLAAGPLALCDAFIAQTLPAIAAICQEITSFTQVEAEEVLGGTEYFSRSISPLVRGTRIGEAMPEFCAWGFELIRAERGKKSGAKRFGLVSETDQNQGAPAAGILAALATCAAELIDPIMVGLVDVWFPVILERPDPLVPGDPWGYHSFSGVLSKGVTTQNTRKR